jgi:hypothetical protein
MCFPSRRYALQFWAGMAAYAILVVAQAYLFKHAALPAEWRVAFALMPILPVAFVAYIAVRDILSVDELERKIQFESIAVSFALTAIVTIGYGFLEIYAKAPNVNLIWVWFVLGMFWGVASLLVRRRYA